MTYVSATYAEVIGILEAMVAVFRIGGKTSNMTLPLRLGKEKQASL